MRRFTLALLAGAMAIALFVSGCGGGGSVSGGDGGDGGDGGGGGSPIVQAGITGSIFTTDSTGTANVNIFADKKIAYLNGGPAYPGAAGLPDGPYYARVTAQDGTVLGKSNGAVVIVSGGVFVQLYKLWDVLYKTDAGGNFLLNASQNMIVGYQTSPNDEYRVWISRVSGFPKASNKTDDFKATEIPELPPAADLQVIKFYDANVNGINDDGLELTGWLVDITNNASYQRFTPVTMTLDPGTYTITEGTPVPPGTRCEPPTPPAPCYTWTSTTPPSVSITLNDGDARTVEFGNVCIGEGGAKSKSYWSGCTNQQIGSDDLAMLAALNLRCSNGTNFNPTSVSSLTNWLRNASTNNMAYMLSAQLATMELNVFNGLVNGTAYVAAPGTNSANALGYATVNALMAEANAELGVHGTAYSNDAWRAYQQTLKNALDNANKNITFVRPTPGTFAFAENPI